MNNIMVKRMDSKSLQPVPPFHDKNEETPDIGGGLSVIEYWAEHTLSPEGAKLWKTLLHKSACLSCSWGTGGQKGGFTNEVGEKLQRCMKSVEAISAEIKPAVPAEVFQQRSIPSLQCLTSLEADRLGRLSFPMILRSGTRHYERISWSEVFDIAEQAFRKAPDRVASYSSGRSSNEAAFLLQLMMRSLGSNNLADCSDLCHAPSTFGLKQMFGTNTSVVSLESLKHADCVVLAGANSAYNHPRLMNELIKLRDRGGKVIVINPAMEIGLVKFGSPAFPIKSLIPGSEISSLYLQPIPGSDVALFVGIQKSLIDRGFAKIEFLTAHTEGWEAVIEAAQSTSWETITATCGVSQPEIEAAATTIGNAKGVVFGWAMGITQQENGVDNVFSIGNTALITGNIGREGTGVMPVRGHSNVQGFGSMGVTTQELKKGLQDALEKLLGHPLSKVKGYDTRDLIEAADQDKVETLICLGGNLYGANPDSTQAKRSLGKIDTIIYLATKPNIGHFHGLAKHTTIVLPVLNRFENPYKTTTESGNNFVRLSDEGETHLKDADLIAEVEFLTELAHRIHGDYPVNWRKLRDPKFVRQLIAETVPGYEKMATIDETREEFTISGRILSQPKFSTPSGKASMSTTPLPTLKLPEPQSFNPSNPKGIVVAIMTGRSYAQHNTVVYQIGDKYRGMPHRNCILMNRSDAESAGLSEHQRVTVQGDAGKLERVEVIYGAVRPGAAVMFYPEVNVIFKAKLETRSGTPAFKRVPALVHA